MKVLLHSSKTMSPSGQPRSKPHFADEASELVGIYKAVSVAELARLMKTSEKIATRSKDQFEKFNKADHGAAIHTFIGDIYSGFQSQTLTTDQATFAQDHLLLLSGLYGALRPFDEVAPYRLEMGYPIPSNNYSSLYDFWGAKIASMIEDDTILNTSSVEYTKAVLPHTQAKIITPKFLTGSGAQAKQVTVHSKIARGALARHAINKQATDVDDILDFSDLGYKYSPTLSSDSEPVFVATVFRGIGKSVRLRNNKV